jgi:transposase
MVDSSSIRVHQHAANAQKNGPGCMGRSRGCPSAFLYRYRNLVERFFNRLKHFRAVATRHDKRDDNFLA